MSNTTSHLGAQQSPYNYVMNTAFITLGLITIIHFRFITTRYPLLKALLTLFSIGLIGVGIFQHAPLTSADGNLVLDRLHSIFASMTGFSFTLVALVSIFILESPKEKGTALILCIISVTASFLMFRFTHYQGIFQRFMFLCAFTWLGLLKSKLENLKE